MSPDTIILDCSAELHQFRSVVCSDLDNPSLVDLYAALGRVIYAISSIEHTDFQLTEVAADMAGGDGLFENETFEDLRKTVIYDAVIRLGYQLQDKLRYLNAYFHDRLIYVHGALFDVNTIVLSRSAELPTAHRLSAICRP